MKQFAKKPLLWSIGALLASSVVTTVQADTISSAQAVVSFEDFTLSWLSNGAQVDAGDFDSLSVNSSQLTAANLTGFVGVSDNPSSATGGSLYSESTLGVIDPAITGIPGGTSTVFNVTTLPLTGNFSTSASNEEGSPTTGFFASSTPANLHNASYASLDTVNGTAGTSTSSTLSSDFDFTIGSAFDGDSLVFDFDAGFFASAFLSLGAGESAFASYSIQFNLIDLNDAVDPQKAFFITGDSASDNSPGDGTEIFAANNSSVTGGFVDLTNFSFTSDALDASHNFRLEAEISTRVQVEREVPAPATITLMGIGLLGFAARFRKAKNMSDTVI